MKCQLTFLQANAGQLSHLTDTSQESKLEQFTLEKQIQKILIKNLGNKNTLRKLLMKPKPGLIMKFKPSYKN